MKKYTWDELHQIDMRTLLDILKEMVAYIGLIQQVIKEKEIK